MPSSLSARLSLWVALFVAILFLATFSLMFYYARESVRAEAVGRANDLLEKMEVTVDNILNEKVVVARQAHWNVEQNMATPEKIEDYLQEILKNEPDITGVAAAFEPGYYPNHKGEYMIYYYRNGSKLVRSEQFAGESYMHQSWYEDTKNRGTEYWSEPAEDYRTNDEPIISFGIPLRHGGKIVGVFAIDLSLYWLSTTVEGKRPLPSMFGAVATRKGAFIVHPDTAQLKPRAMFKMMEQFPDDKYSFLAYKMLGGETGSMTIDFYGQKSFVAYKPMRDGDLVIDVVCPEEEVMAKYNDLISLMVLIVVLALLLVLGFCYFFIYRELVPLKSLEDSAKQMIKGDYFSPIPSSDRQDEVGSLTSSFITMRRSIKKHIDEIDHTREKLDEQNKALNEAHVRIKEADRVKAVFLQNMTDQMDAPIKEITRIVGDVKLNLKDMDQERIAELAQQIDDNSQAITTLLSRMLEVATNKKEGAL